jgi:transposase-like protein
MTYPQIKDWPTDEETESRMVPIIQNGNKGDHFNGVCPKCTGRNLVKRGLDNGFQRYECKFCLHKFKYKGQ